MRHTTAAIVLTLALLAGCTNSHPWEPKVVAIKCEEDPEVPGKLVCREIPADSTSYGKP